MRSNRGFTLIELIVTMVVAAILLALAVPGFQGFQRSSAVSTAASSFMAALNSARAEAIKTARPVVVMATSGKNWALGWTVFVDWDGNGVFDASKGDIKVLEQAAVANGVSTPVSTNAPAFVSGNSAGLRFNSYGLPASAASLPSAVDFTATFGSQTTTRRVIIGVIGRPRICDPLDSATGSTCTTSVD